MRLEAVLAVFKWFTGSAEIRTPECTVLPDGRKRLVRYFAIADPGSPPPCLAWPYGSLDATSAPDGWTDLRLVAKRTDDQLGPRGRDNRPVAVLTYETLTVPGETPVGEWKRMRLEDGRDAWSREWLQLLTETATPATVGAVYPATAIVSGVTTYLQREETSPDEARGVRHIVRTVATAGRVFESIEGMDMGLRRVTWTCLGAAQTPAGVVVGSSTRNANGFPEFSVTCIQSAAGETPAGYTFTYEKMVQITHPGRAQAYSTTVEGATRVLANVFLSPPVEMMAKGVVTVTYDTTATLTEGTLYQPLSWATVEAKYLTRLGRPVAKLESLRGYRAVGTGQVSNVSVSAPSQEDPDAPGGSILGDFVYGGTVGYVRVSGGPADPSGNTYTVDCDNDPVFVGLDGTRYYRHLVLRVTFPTLPSLPTPL